jgi:hypothetical protein
MKKKYLKTLQTTRNGIAAGWALSSNILYRNTIFEGKKEFLGFVDIYEQMSGVRISYD